LCIIVRTLLYPGWPELARGATTEKGRRHGPNVR
jgi:predicted phosphoribosyltransferase